jgi:hypothetical protein
MTAIDPQTTYLRALEAQILAMLVSVWAVGAAMRMDLSQIAMALAKGSVPPTENQTRLALADLLDRGLIARQDAAEYSRDGQPTYGPTAKGRDFDSHGYPWDKVDSFA